MAAPDKGLRGLDIIVGMGGKGASKGPPAGRSKPMGGGEDESDMPNMFDKPDDDDDAPDEMMVGAADSIMSALHHQDSEGLADALKSFISMC